MTSIFRTVSFQVARILLKLAVDRALQKELPAIFKRLDLTVPYMLMNKANPLQVQAAVTEAIEEKLGGIATATQVAAVLSLYNPVKAALRNIR
jgi:hypothetical protein